MSDAHAIEVRSSVSTQVYKEFSKLERVVFDDKGKAVLRMHEFRARHRHTVKIDEHDSARYALLSGRLQDNSWPRFTWCTIGKVGVSKEWVIH